MWRRGYHGAARRGRISEDVPILDEYKFDERAADFHLRGAELINELLRSEIAYIEAWTQQAAYRDWIRGQKAAFLAEVDEFIAAMDLRR